MLGLGIKRYTTDANRATAYGVFYAFMNVGEEEDGHPPFPAHPPPPAWPKTGAFCVWCLRCALLRAAGRLDTVTITAVSSCFRCLCCVCVHLPSQLSRCLLRLSSWETESEIMRTQRPV